LSKKKKYPKDIRISIEEELHGKLLALAESRGETMADIIRPVLHQMVDEKAAQDGIDVVNDAVRKAVVSAMKPIENRLAAMTAKATIASATTMYTNHRLMESNGVDSQKIIKIHEESRKKAVSYLRVDMNQLTE
jgi:hypothetical protein